MPWWAVVALAVVGLWLAVVIVLAVVAGRVAVRELVSLVPNLVRLFRGLLHDPRVPVTSKVGLGLAVIWLASPIDLIPEFIPVLGPLDDVVVAYLALRHIVRRSGPDVLREYWRGDPRALDLVLRLGGRRSSA